MKYLKKVISAVLIYMAFYLPFVCIISGLTGVDLSAAFGGGSAVGAVELALGAVIEIIKHKYRIKDNTEDVEDGQNKLERKTFEP